MSQVAHQTTFLCIRLLVQIASANHIQGHHGSTAFSSWKHPSWERPHKDICLTRSSRGSCKGETTVQTWCRVTRTLAVNEYQNSLKEASAESPIMNDRSSLSMRKRHKYYSHTAEQPALQTKYRRVTKCNNMPEAVVQWERKVIVPLKAHSPMEMSTGQKGLTSVEALAFKHRIKPLFRHMGFMEPSPMFISKFWSPFFWWSLSNSRDVGQLQLKETNQNVWKS